MGENVSLIKNKPINPVGKNRNSIVQPPKQDRVGHNNDVVNLSIDYNQEPAKAIKDKEFIRIVSSDPGIAETYFEKW